MDQPRDEIRDPVKAMLTSHLVDPGLLFTTHLVRHGRSQEDVHKQNAFIKISSGKLLVEGMSYLIAAELSQHCSLQADSSDDVGTNCVKSRHPRPKL